LLLLVVLLLLPGLPQPLPVVPHARNFRLVVVVLLLCLLVVLPAV
jgi:hypothetical protein